MAKVNLDALIQREDFSIEDKSEDNIQKTPAIKINDLENSAFFFNSLRKPDFQRETSDWDPLKNFDFIKSFTDGELIPAIILWKSGKYTFVIDGAHRLSALLSWVNDDYGDGTISRSFFDNNIANDQIKMAQKTRELVNSQIGQYKSYYESLKNNNLRDTDIYKKALMLGSLSIQLQWVSGDEKKAEDSFFKINQQAAPIDATELELLKSRKKPYAIAARAIVRAGTGHKYWDQFEKTKQNEIQGVAKEINNVLFEPEYKNPIKTLDLPLAGKGYSSKTLPLILDLVKISNNVVNTEKIESDDNGDETLVYLNKVKKISHMICGNNPGSLGLHPAVYFYSAGGRYQQTPFLAILEFIKELENRKILKTFIELRKQFEEFLITHKFFINQFTMKHGSGRKGYKPVAAYFLSLLKLISEGKNNLEIENEFLKNYKHLSIKDITSSDEQGDFTQDTKSAIFLREALSKALKCNVCGGYIHKNAISFDHIQRKEDGGSASSDNGQLSHPYCNTGYKN